ncbi:MAG: bifunctional diaminohydroxyphosphoribosylaminopyrimidine deaminase/5-amino-6-(5-phosphoribosylamino)uracil reductase RibD [Deltaproteobacteria bacterium]|nr:bifunctional diaminohydroxyphosphoribosylaminopyrimidine deaminase/5-amino-6-(5-phosphoribosylamino)uracil reductase RibD [Deltaproteobacteria bacterium]MBI3016624.1 bifunctional diaminohydroxyphosphoribosylaminopyrimidine deaminase/5-amino-6-(5-phosphoribosylamino)uracil reductase RibD [Deltaproteobacteria bacterium]
MLQEHIPYMKMALDLARHGEGLTSPNPMVGALIVKDGEIVGRGFHLKAGEDHAEIIALKEAGERARGGILYITLEPCCHVGKTGPCTEAIVKAGIRKVVVGMQDPNDLVNGKGMRELKRLGVEIEAGVLEKECQELNEFFTFWIKHQTPFVILKTASTLDGKIATFKGESKWITSEESRNMVQSLRNKVDAIIVGIGTIMTDNPSLSLQSNKDRMNPLRIVVDSKLRISPRAKVLKVDEKHRTMVVTTRKATLKKRKALERKGVEVVVVPDKRGRVSIVSLLKLLGKQGVLSVLVEGGAEVNASFLKEKLAHKIYTFMAPRILGDDALGAYSNMGLSDLDQAIKIKNVRMESVGKDFLIQGYF